MGDVDDQTNPALLSDLLDRSFGPGPEGLPTPAERLAAGRRSRQRRRRVAVAGSSVAVVIAVGVGAAVGGGGDRAAEGPQLPLATSGTSPTASPERAEDRQRALDRLARKAREQAQRVEQRLVSDQFPAAYGADGVVVVKDGWRITQRVEEPMGYRPPEASLGVVLTNGEDTRWMLLFHQTAQDQAGHPLPGAFGDSASADDPGKGYSRFEDWLASMVELQGGARTPPLVEVGADDVIAAGPGATVVATAPAPVIADYTSAGDRMARVERDGRTWFVVVRGHGARAEVIPVDAAVLDAPTFDAFVDHLAAQADSGEGVR